MQFVGIGGTNGLIPKINVNDFALMMILLLGLLRLVVSIYILNVY